jgi:signal transduction histidine kinase
VKKSLKKTPKKTTDAARRARVSEKKGGELRKLQEEVRALKRKLWVVERMRFDAASKGPVASKLSWDGRLLAAGVAHEFNNILGAADGHAEWALDTGSPYDMAEALQVVRQACRRSLQITKSLQGLPTPREEEAGVFALKSVATDLKKHFQPLEKKMGVEFSVEVPEADLYGNEAQLFEVLVNLVKNAFESLLASATPKPRIEFQGRLVGREHVKLIVGDNGPGVPKALKERLFHPFFTTKGRMKEMLGESSAAAAPASGAGLEGGSGLGLFLSRSIVQNMGGRLEHLASKQGARFLISLPLASKSRRPRVQAK